MRDYNDMSPFPVYDTERVKHLEGLVEDIEYRHTKGANSEFDEIPVAACLYCNSLHILTDDLDNDVCAKCGAVNEIRMYDHIDDYLKGGL